MALDIQAQARKIFSVKIGDEANTVAGSSSQARAKNQTREQYKLHLDTLANEGRVIQDQGTGELWAEWVTRQCKDLGCRDFSHHAETAERVRKALGSLRKNLADNPKTQRLHPARFLSRISDRRIVIADFGELIGESGEIDPVTLSATGVAWMDTAHLSKALGRMEQSLSGTGLGYFNTSPDLSALGTQHRHVLRWVTPFPQPTPIGPGLISLEDGDKAWVRRQQSRFVIGAKVPTSRILRTLLKKRHEFRDEILPAVVAHNQLLIIYGEALVEINDWARRLLSYDDTDEVVTYLVDRLRALHCMLRDAREL